MLVEVVRIRLNPCDKQKLRALSARDGDAGMSATLRRLIRDEALRRGLDSSHPSPDNPTPALPGAGREEEAEA